MSAPPMGSVTPTPSRLEATKSSHSGAPPGSAGSVTSPARDASARAMLTPWRRRLWVQAGVSIQPSSLAIATSEPVKVMAPTNTEMAIEIRSTSSAPPSATAAPVAPPAPSP